MPTGTIQLDDDKLAAISRHDHCALGPWLESDEAQGRASADMLNDIQQRHGHFNQLAGELFKAAQNNEQQDFAALRLAFIEDSHQLIVDLAALRDTENPASVLPRERRLTRRPVNCWPGESPPRA